MYSPTCNDHFLNVLYSMQSCFAIIQKCEMYYINNVVEFAVIAANDTEMTAALVL